MDYSFIKEDLLKDARCESCEREADHVMVLVDKVMIGVFQVCYDCTVMVDFGGKDFRFIPKKNAKLRNNRCSPLCNPRDESSAGGGTDQSD